MTPVDDISVKDYIAITGPKVDKHGQPYADSRAHEGVVLKVLAKSLPFLAVDYNGQVVTLDTRKFTFTRCSKQYAKVMLATLPKQNSGKEDVVLKDKCPQCGDRLIQRWMAASEWAAYCRQCSVFVTFEDEDNSEVNGSD